MSSPALQTTASTSRGARTSPHYIAARTSSINCSAQRHAGLPAAPRRPAARSRPTAAPACAEYADVSLVASATRKTSGSQHANKDLPWEQILPAAQAAANRALELATQRGINLQHSPSLQQAAVAMQQMLRLALSCGTPSCHSPVTLDAVALFTASVAPLLAAGLLSPVDTVQLMGQAAAAEAQDFCFLLNAVAKAAGDPRELSNWCLEASHPQAVLVFALWLLTCVAPDLPAPRSAPTLQTGALQHAQDLAALLLRGLGIKISRLSDTESGSSSSSGSASAQPCSTTSLGQVGGHPVLRLSPAAKLWDAPLSGGSLGSRAVPRVCCSSTRVEASERPEGLLAMHQGQEDDGEGPAAERSRQASSTAPSTGGLVGPNGARSRQDTVHAGSRRPAWGGPRDASDDENLGEPMQGQVEPDWEEVEQGGQDSMAGPEAGGPGQAGLRRPTRQAAPEQEAPLPGAWWGVDPEGQAGGWMGPNGTLLGVMDRPPPPDLELEVQGRLASTISPHRLVLPSIGPWIISNSFASYPASDVEVQLRVRNRNVILSPEAEWQWSRNWDGVKLALRFEFIADRQDPLAPPVLHVFNISRVSRGRERHSAAYVNGQCLLPGDRGVPLAQGDMVSLGVHPSCASDPARDRHAMHLVVQPAGKAKAAELENRFGVPGHFPVAVALKWHCEHHVKRLRQEPRPGVEKFKADVFKDPSNTDAWLALARLSSQFDGPKGSTITRDFFRAAFHSVDLAEQAMQRQQQQAAAASREALSEARAARARAEGGQDASSSSSSPLRSPLQSELGQGMARPSPPPFPATPAPSQAFPTPAPASPAWGGAGSEAQGPASPLSTSWPLDRRRIQVLYFWASAEWSLGCRGSARHLWRRAADLSFRHPSGPSTGGHWRIMHAWATAELAADNVSMARVALAQALRRTPGAQPLYVLGGSVELAAGNLELAKGFCARAYEMDRLEESLYLVWPKVEAELGQRDRARVLFERGREYHPKSVQLLEAYAEFEARNRDHRKARTLYLKAIEVCTDPHSALPIRAKLASMEVELGRLDAAHNILEEGRALRPSHPDLLLASARLERASGNLVLALQLLRQVDKVRGFYRTDVTRERLLITRAFDEPDIAAALEAHLHALERVQVAKKQGLPGWEAWSEYYKDVSGSRRQELARRSRARKVELGLWKAGPFLRPAWKAAAPGSRPQVFEEGVSSEQQHDVAKGHQQHVEELEGMMAQEGSGREVLRPVWRPDVPQVILEKEARFRERLWQERRERMEARERLREQERLWAEAQGLLEGDEQHLEEGEEDMDEGEERSYDPRGMSYSQEQVQQAPVAAVAGRLRSNARGRRGEDPATPWQDDQL